MEGHMYTVFTIFLVTFPRTEDSVLGECLPNKFGPGCRYACHCKPEVTCNPDSGCPGKCAEGWDGPTCQRQNVALKRHATIKPNHALGAYKAVDGNTTVKSQADCALAAWTDTLLSPSEWSVTLDQEYNINKFIIYLRTDCCRDRMTGFTVDVGQTSHPDSNYRQCYKDQTSSGPQSVVREQCSSPVRGDTVRIRTGKNTPISVCEVIIPVCAPGTWGENCTQPCGHCWNNNPCSGVNGTCPINGKNPRCFAGNHGAQCRTACESGTWGEDCRKNCSINCDRQECDGTTGHCVKCVLGYEGDFCDRACESGTWSEDCRKNCSINCDRQGCDGRAGHCVNCVSGYEGDFCDRACESGTWGEDCRKNCGINCDRQECDGRTGHCVKCVSGYEGDFCDTVVKETENTQSDNNNVGTIVGGVSATIGVISLSVVAIVFILTKYRRQRPEVSLSTVKFDGGNVNPLTTEKRNVSVETEQNDHHQYENMDNHDYSEIRHSNMGEETNYTSLK